MRDHIDPRMLRYTAIVLLSCSIFQTVEEWYTQMNHANRTDRFQKLSRLGALPYYLLPIRKQVIKTNLSLVYDGQLTAAETKHLTQAVYGNLMKLGLEVVKNRCLSQSARRAKLDVVNFDSVERAFSQEKGVLLFSCHFGNWEVALANLLAKIPLLQGRMTVIRKMLRPKWLNSLVINHFVKAGIDVLPTESATMKRVLRKLRNNEVVVFVMDQHTSEDRASRVKLFGRDVYLTKSLARVALLNDIPVIPVFALRKDTGQHVVRFGDPIPLANGDSYDDIVKNTTQLYASVIENVVSEHPEQWFCWMHRLWKASQVYG